MKIGYKRKFLVLKRKKNVKDIFINQNNRMMTKIKKCENDE